MTTLQILLVMLLGHAAFVSGIYLMEIAKLTWRFVAEVDIHISKALIWTSLIVMGLEIAVFFILRAVL